MKDYPERGLESSSSILCVVDLSDWSKSSIVWSVQMAEILAQHLTILHTFRLLQYKKEEAFFMKRKAEAESADRFAVLEKILLEGKDVSYDFRTEVGFISDRVERFTQENETSLVVISRKVTGESKESLEELLNGIGVPLVIIP